MQVHRNPNWGLCKGAHPQDYPATVSCHHERQKHKQGGVQTEGLVDDFAVGVFALENRVYFYSILKQRTE